MMTFSPTRGTELVCHSATMRPDWRISIRIFSWIMLVVVPVEAVSAFAVTAVFAFHMTGLLEVDSIALTRVAVTKSVTERICGIEITREARVLIVPWIERTATHDSV